MKQKSVNRILEYFPVLKKYLESTDDQMMTKNDLSTTERVFLDLALFFQSPRKNNFDIKEIYLHLRDDWLIFAFECIELFFKEDTFLLSKDYLMTINDREELFNQNQFANYLQENGINFDRKKLHMYNKRGKIPTADVIFNNKPYWYQSTVDSYVSLMKRI